MCMLTVRSKRKTENDDSTNIGTQHEDMHYKQNQVMETRINLGSEENSVRVNKEPSFTFNDDQDEYKISKAKKVNIIDK